MTSGSSWAKLILEEKSGYIRIFSTAKYYTKPGENLHLQPKVEEAYSWLFNIPGNISY